MKKMQKVLLPTQEDETPFQCFERLAKKVIGVHKDVVKKRSKVKRHPSTEPTH